MSTHEASRTLLKSPPELWAECSDARSLARHLDDSFGEIRITKLEPEQAVAWEGERICGTVKLEPSGWGTKVTLTASAPEPEPSSAPSADRPSADGELDRSGAEPEAERPAADGELDRSGAQPEPDRVVAEPSADRSAAEPEPDHAVPEPKPNRAAAEPERSYGPVRRGFLSRLRYLLWAPDRSRMPAPDPTRPPPDAAPLAFDAILAERDMTPAAPDATPARSDVTPAVGDPTAHQAADVPESPPSEAQDPEADAALTAALDSLGRAHHRPFSNV